MNNKCDNNNDNRLAISVLRNERNARERRNVRRGYFQQWALINPDVHSAREIYRKAIGCDPCPHPPYCFPPRHYVALRTVLLSSLSLPLGCRRSVT